MSCLCGSKKQSTAPNTINPVNIGVLCFLFGIEGALCALLDLLPDAIQAVMTLNPEKGNADDVFRGLLKKVAKTSLGIIVDEATGNIDLESFCSSPPPPLPEEINYSDIYIFIADLVPILSHFFKVNDVLTGNSTRLLDKIVGYWLYKQWYENCECKNCPPPDDFSIPENQYPEFTVPTCNDGSERCKNLILRLRQLEIYSCHGFWVFRGSSTGNLDGNSRQQYTETYFPLEIKQSDLNSLSQGIQYHYELHIQYTPPRLENPTSSYDYLNEYGDRIWGNVSPYVDNQHTRSKVQISNDGVNFNDFDGNSDGYFYPPCPPPPPPPPPSEFCDLYPDHPDCSNTSDDCENEYALCGEFMGCDAILRRPVRKALIKNGVNHQVTVTEFLDCGVVGTRTIDYFECPPQGVSGCTDPIATNYNPLATIDDGSCDYGISGCTDPSATNYDPFATIDDGSCDYGRYGCTDSGARNYDVNATIDDGSCTYYFYGCTDPSAFNYDPNANTDDGTCVFAIGGCTDPAANNYDPNATTDDGSCTYD